jgi:hypothetical protein
VIQKLESDIRLTRDNSLTHQDDPNWLGMVTQLLSE